MVATLLVRRALSARAIVTHWRDALVLMVLTVAGFIVQFYLGQAPGFYGVWYAENGRSLRCELKR